MRDEMRILTDTEGDFSLDGSQLKCQYDLVRKDGRQLSREERQATSILTDHMISRIIDKSLLDFTLEQLYDTEYFREKIAVSQVPAFLRSSLATSSASAV
jgi:hypothetical protein